MTHQAAEAIPYIAGLTTVSLSVMGQVVDASAWLQAGFAGVVVLLLLKFFPMLMHHLEEKDRKHNEMIRETNDRHEETIRNIVERNEKKDAAWQSIVQDRGICPITSEPKNNQN